VLLRGSGTSGATAFPDSLPSSGKAASRIISAQLISFTRWAASRACSFGLLILHLAMGDSLLGVGSHGSVRGGFYDAHGAGSTTRWHKIVCTA
jgi:hypothetical protein